MASLREAVKDFQDELRGGMGMGDILARGAFMAERLPLS